jgi:glycosyltransferase involved in cell wall biosynthesis
MGAQGYQAEIAARAADALAASNEGRHWSVVRVVARSMRSPLPGNRRLPMGIVTGAWRGPRSLLGGLLYPRGAIVHRMSLELPPGPIDVVTLHDTVAWTQDDESSPVRAAVAELRRAAAVIAVSQFTADDARERLGVNPTHVVPNGVGPRFFDARPLTAETLARLEIRGAYVLHSGGASRRKNLESLADAWPVVAAANPGTTLVLAGPPHRGRTALFRGMPDVRLLGMVEAGLVPGLVAGAAAVVVPSLIEGFGLPALEAMAAGTPVVAADASALPEVVHDGGLLVPPTADGLIEGLASALAHGPEISAMVLRGRARAGTFTWERCAEGHAEVWTSLA